MNILFVGDVVGEPGRMATRKIIPNLAARYDLGFVIINGENSAGGNGFTVQTVKELFASGADVITSGDHVWDNRDIMDVITQENRLIRPLNYPNGTPGQGSVIVQARSGMKVGVINVQGRTFMPPLENPFISLRNEVDKILKHTSLIFVDVHAEATSEKIAIGRFLDGKVSGVFGTHTHVQTADEQIFPGGTAYISDAGMTGPMESVLGRDIDAVLKRFITQMPQRLKVAEKDVRLHGVIVEVDDLSGRARNIQRVSEKLVDHA